MTNPHVLSFPTNDTQGKAARFTIGTDVIDYMESSRAFGREDLSDPNADGRFQRRMIAIPDQKGGIVTPMVLTISNQNQLYLVRKTDESKSADGWKLIDLSHGFKQILGDRVRVLAHGAAWTQDDRITIAVAVDDGVSERSRVFVAYDLSSLTSNWEDIQWIDCGSRENIRVEGIRVLDSGAGEWTIVLAGDRGPNDMLYLLRNTVKKDFSQALVFNPSVTLEEILDFETAVHPTLGAGIAVLGVSNGLRHLSFRPFPQYKADGSFGSIPPVEILPCPQGANVLETGLTKLIQKGRRRNVVGSDLYIGGQGVHAIQAIDILQVVVNGGTIKTTTIASPEAAPNVQDLIVGESPDGMASVWALLQNGDLNVIKKVKAAEWGEPLRLRVGVQAIAPVHGDEHLTTSLLMVYANGQASFLLRNESQGLWQERPLAVASPQEVVQITCYGTTLRVLGADNIPQADIKVKVSASVLSSVVLNGNAVFIAPTIAFETKTDSNGGISLFDRVQSLTPAVYRFEVEGFAQAIDVNPANGIQAKFQSMTADELRAAKISTPKGEVPLLPENFRTGADRHQVDAVAGSLNNLTQLAQSSNAIVSGVSLVSAGADFSSKLQAQALPDNYSWGIKTDSKGITQLLVEDVNKLIHSDSVGEFFENLGDTIVDFFEGVGHAVKEGVTFILHKVAESDVFKFICKIGNQVKSFVVETLEQIGSAMTWLWDQVKTGLDKVWNYVKFLFEWEDILIARDMMVKATDEALLYLQSSTTTLKQGVDAGFDQAIATIRQWQKDIGVPPAELPRPAAGQSASDLLQSQSGEQQSLYDQISGNSVISWVMDKLHSVLDEIIHIEGADPSAVALKTALDFVGGLAGDQFNNLVNLWEQIQADIAKIFGNKMPGTDSLSFDTIKHVIIAVGADLVVGLLEGIRDLVLRSIDLLGGMLEVVRAAMFAKISFPFIEKLVALVLPGVQIDTSFRFVDAIMLLVSIPATVAYKIIFGEAPFKKGDVLNLPFGRVAVQSDPVKAIMPFAGLAGGILKTVVAVYLTKKAFVAKAEGAAGPISKPGIILGLVFGGIGLAAEILGRHSPEKEHNGGVIGALEMSAVGAASFCLVSSTAFAVAKWHAVPDSPEIDAGITIVGTIAQVALGTAVFGILIDYLRQSGNNYEQMRQATESCRWTGRLFDQAGTIMFAAAVIDPELVTKAILCAIGAGLKAGALVCVISQVTTQKLVLEPLQA
jgi:hypothetical protein